jgi:hypothetical protein
MPFAELGPFSRREAKLLASLNPVFTVLLSKYFTARITINKKAPVFRLGLRCLGAFMPLAELMAVQPERSQIVGFSKSRLHCTTLQVLHRQNHDK